MSTMDDRQKALVILLAVTGVMATLVGVDLLADYDEGSSPRHLLIEFVLLGVSVLAFGFSLKSLFNLQSTNKDLLTKVASLSQEKEKWKQDVGDLVRGLSHKIENQFNSWHLSQAETEVGFLLLKGFALKEISEIRGTKLKTVQQQAQSIYQKTQLANRSELSAFFLEDLLPPLSEQGHPPRTVK